jgi:hypothetical protein
VSDDRLDMRDDVERAEDDTDAEYVDDIAALRRAEEAVAHDRPAPTGSPVGIGEDWLPVASSAIWPAGLAGLEEVGDLLDSAGIPFGWTPHDPHENSVGFLPPAGLVPGSRSAFSVLVQASRLADARRALEGSPPPWVTYSDPSVAGTIPAPSDSQPVPSDLADSRYSPSELADSQFSPRAPSTGPTGIDASPWSDNASLQGAVQPSGGCGLTLAFALLLLVAVVVIYFIVTRG